MSNSYSEVVVIDLLSQRKPIFTQQYIYCELLSIVGKVEKVLC